MSRLKVLRSTSYPAHGRAGEEHHFPFLPVNSRSLLTVLADSSAGLAARRAAAARDHIMEAIRGAD